MGTMIHPRKATNKDFRDALHFIEFQMLPKEVDELVQVDNLLKRCWLADFIGDQEKPEPRSFCEAINYIAMNCEVGSNGDLWDNDYYSISDLAHELLPNTAGLEIKVLFAEI